MGWDDLFKLVDNLFFVEHVGVGTENNICVWDLLGGVVEYAFAYEAWDVFLFHDFHDVEDVLQEAFEVCGVVEGDYHCSVLDSGLDVDGFGVSFTEVRELHAAAALFTELCSISASC